VSEAIQALRRQLREKFPQAHAAWTEREDEEAASPFEPEAFPVGAISEVVPAEGLSALSLLVARLLGEPEERAELPDFILVDGGDSFDPASYTEAACSRLLWVRCSGGAMPLMKAADLLIRDGNVPFILLDLCGLAREEMRQVRSSHWWRLKLAAEKSGCRVVVMSPFPQVPCATLRVRLSGALGLEDFELPRHELLERLRVTPERLRYAT
jgi:hypothetical protein